MRPSRFDPHETPVSLIIDNLVYVMDQMVQKDPSNGIAFIANMESWKMTNFSMDYCLKFMNVLQGKEFPVKVDLFLILNPPSWFGKVWAIMKPMLSEAFRKRVHMIRDNDFSIHLNHDCEDFLPDEISVGEVDTGTLVRDFVLFQQTVEHAASSGEPATNLFTADGLLRGYASRLKKIEAASARCASPRKRRSKASQQTDPSTLSEHNQNPKLLSSDAWESTWDGVKSLSDRSK